MDLLYGGNNDSQVSPIHGRNFIGGGRFYPGPKTKILDPYASSDSSSAGSSVYPLVQYLHSSGSRSGSSGSGGGGYFRSPLASIERIASPPVFRTPVKDEEDVVVMDGILVGQKYGARAKSSPSTSDSGGRLSSSSTSGSEKDYQKAEACRRWEDSGTCRFGSKCRFVHGKENLRPTAFTNWNQSEIIRSHSSGSYSYGPRGRFVHQQGQSAATPTKAGMITPTKQVVSGKKENEPPARGSSTTSTSTSGPISGNDWCPLDDNIEVFLPPSGEKCTSREDVNAHIQKVLYGPSGRKRLSVFTALTSE